METKINKKKRIKKILHYWYLKYGNNGYVINIDYSKYFENCNHDIIKIIHEKYIKNEYLIKVIEDYLFINKGLSLGIEIAQKEALMIPNKLDHFVNNKYKVVRFMKCKQFSYVSKLFFYFRY